MPAVYCFTEIDQIAHFQIYKSFYDELNYDESYDDESMSASELVIKGTTKKTFIEGERTNSYLQEYAVNVEPGEYILQTAQVKNEAISRR